MRGLRRLKDGWSRLLRDYGGNILPLAAVGIILIAAIVGGGLDMSRAYMTESRLQAACDAGTLAGRRAVGSEGYDQAAQDRAREFFAANYSDDAMSTRDTTFATHATDKANTVQGRATTTLDLAVMQLFGFDAIELEADCASAMGMGNSDVVMVLDVTGSMACTASMNSNECGNYIGRFGYSETAHGRSSRMADLREAMTNFYDTVAAATSGSNARVRYSFVPYSSAVNVGSLIRDLNPAFLADSSFVQSRRAVWRFSGDNPVIGEGNYDVGTYYRKSGYYTSRNICENNKVPTIEWRYTGRPLTVNLNGQQRQVWQRERIEGYCEHTNGKGWWVREKRETIWRVFQYIRSVEFAGWSHEPVLYDTSSFKMGRQVTTPTGNNGSDQSSTWRGCVEERSTISADSFSADDDGRIRPSAAFDLDIDSEPTADPDTQWRPMWGQVAYYRRNLEATYSSRNEGTIFSVCPTQARVLAPLDRSNFASYARSLRPEGGTYHDIGMLWGARLISPDGIFGRTVNEEPRNGQVVARHLIFMTDGEMAPGNSALSTYGIELLDRRVSPTGDNGGLEDYHNERFSAICEAIKAKGIRIWVIAFAANLGSDDSRRLDQCASPGSSFSASDSAQLNATFQRIAKNVGELRVTQ